MVQKVISIPTKEKMSYTHTHYLTKIHYTRIVVSTMGSEYPWGVLIDTNITIDMIILITKVSTKYKMLKSHTSSKY